jgi:hypothetical protein
MLSPEDTRSEKEISQDGLKAIFEATSPAGKEFIEEAGLSDDFEATMSANFFIFATNHVNKYFNYQML